MRIACNTCQFSKPSVITISITGVTVPLSHGAAKLFLHVFLRAIFALLVIVTRDVTLSRVTGCDILTARIRFRRNGCTVQRRLAGVPLRPRKSQSSNVCTSCALRIGQCRLDWFRRTSRRFRA
jgi:hypothetical protein